MAVRVLRTLLIELISCLSDIEIATSAQRKIQENKTLEAPSDESLAPSGSWIMV